MSEAQRPDPLSALEARLAAVRFAPRASLGAELAGRAGRGELPVGPGRMRPRWLGWAAAVALLLAGAGAARAWIAGRGPVDRCCADYDGEGAADDGILVARGRPGHLLLIYEDRDGSRTLSAGDRLRWTRGAEPPDATGELSSVRRCCLDMDGDGPADDGVLVVTRATRVVSATLFERPRHR
jgi:hypothetical protein